jgi:alanine racemase
VEYDLEPEIFSLGLLRRFLHFASRNTLLNYPVHLKLETGMHRLGFEVNEIPELVQILKNNNLIHIKTVFSHLVGSEDPGLDEFTRTQNELFVKCCSMLESGLGYRFVKHIANSAAIERHSYLQHEMVRLGIGMYGVISSVNHPVQQVCTLKTTIAQIKTVHPGETVGYNRKGTVTRLSRIATVRIGYADGYDRQLGNGKGKMVVNGKLAPTIGSICMDMTMLDITGITNVAEEDFVTVFGENMPVQELANACNTISYEILTGISQRVKRIYYNE